MGTKINTMSVVGCPRMMQPTTDNRHRLLSPIPLRYIDMPRHPLPRYRAAAFVAEAEVAADVGHVHAAGTFVADVHVALHVADVDGAAAVVADVHAAGPDH